MNPNLRVTVVPHPLGNRYVKQDHHAAGKNNKEIVVQNE
jgi:hypothetical protein